VAIVIVEGAAIGLMSGILAALLAWPVSRGLGDLLVTLMFRTRLDFVFEPLGLLGWLTISITLGVVASFVPAWHASRHPVRRHSRMSRKALLVTATILVLGAGVWLFAAQLCRRCCGCTGIEEVALSVTTLRCHPRRRDPVPGPSLDKGPVSGASGRRYP
jgi:hypothetical protein